MLVRVYNASTRLQRQHAPIMLMYFLSSTLSNLLVSAAATSPITIATDMPCDPTSLVPICIQTQTDKFYTNTPINPIRSRANMPTEPTLCWHYTVTHTLLTKRLCRYACNLSNASTVLPHTIDKLIAPLGLLL